MLKQKYFLKDIFILSAEKQPIKLSWRKIVWLRYFLQIRVTLSVDFMTHFFSCKSMALSKIVTENFPDFSVTI